MSAKKKFQEAKAKVKGHFVKHQDIYTILAVSVTSAAAGAAVSTAINSRVPKLAETENYSPEANATQSVKAIKVGDVTQNVVQVQLSRPGTKSFVVQCVDDGRIWPSARSAAESLGVSPGAVLGHLHGNTDNVHGFKLVKLTEI